MRHAHIKMMFRLNTFNGQPYSARPRWFLINFAQQCRAGSLCLQRKCCAPGRKYQISMFVRAWGNWPPRQFNTIQLNSLYFPILPRPTVQLDRVRLGGRGRQTSDTPLIPALPLSLITPGRQTRPQPYCYLPRLPHPHILPVRPISSSQYLVGCRPDK